MSLEIIKKAVVTIPHIVRWGIVAAVVLLLSFLFPANLEFHYDFEQGSRWKNEDVKAPFSFPIHKTKEEIGREKAELSSKIVPYYQWDKTLLEDQQQLFLTNFNEQLSSYLSIDSSMVIDSALYADFGKGVLQYIYEKRLIQLDEESEKELPVFHLLDGHVDLGEFTAKDFLSHKDAIQFLLDTLHQVEDQIVEYKFIFSILENVLETPNIRFDSLMTAKSRADIIANISPYRGMVNVGDLIVTRDQLIDSTTYTKLVSYKTKYNEEINEHKNSFVIYLGYMALTLALIGMFIFFAKFYAPSVYHNLRHLSSILAIVVGYAYFAHLIAQMPILNLYLIPFCIVPIILLNFFSSQLALFTHVILILLVALFLGLDYQFILIQILVGMVAIVSKLKTRKLSDYFGSLLYIALAYGAGFLSLEMINKGTFLTVFSENGTMIEEGVRWAVLGWIALNVFLTLLSFPLQVPPILLYSLAAQALA